jgi:hypothetical protein
LAGENFSCDDLVGGYHVPSEKYVVLFSLRDLSALGAGHFFGGERSDRHDGFRRGAPHHGRRQHRRELRVCIENNRFTSVGRRADVLVSAGAARVELKGKTVMPMMIDLHGHIGYQNVAQGTMSKETYTRENLIDHLERLAYHGVSAIVGIGDLLSRSDMRGGRTNWGDVPLRVREEIIPNAALFKTAGAGMAWPGAGAQGHPSRADVMYPVTTVEEARAAVQAMSVFP